jgi:phage-related minor tail protein
MSMVDGTKSVKDAFKQMASDIIKELFRVLVVQKAVAAAKTFFGFADGGAFSGGSQVKAFANGGIVGSPTYFPMSGGQTGLMGEAGPEAIMPLKRGANGKLGVEVQGGSGGVTVNNYFTVQANGDESVKRIVQQQIPRIAEATKAAVVDSKRRGGSYGRAFS